jgi:YD repeat-containing protein
VGKCLRTSLCEATTSTYSLDDFGNTRSIKDADGNETKYEYDALDRLTTTTDPRKKQTIQDYDGLLPFRHKTIGI